MKHAISKMKRIKNKGKHLILMTENKRKIKKTKGISKNMYNKTAKL